MIQFSWRAIFRKNKVLDANTAYWPGSCQHEMNDLAVTTSSYREEGLQMVWTKTELQQDVKPQHIQRQSQGCHSFGY